MAVEILRKKFTVGQYHQMVETGILTERDRVELLQGEIIELSPVGRQHAACVDRTVKVPLYAQDGIAEVWIVDLKAGEVEVYREPRADGYGQRLRFRRGDGLSFQAFADAQFTVDQILG